MSFMFYIFVIIRWGVMRVCGGGIGIRQLHIICSGLQLWALVGQKL